MDWKVGSSYVAEFGTSDPSTGTAANADSTPVATAYVNGVANAWALTVTSLSVAGRYKITGTVPSLAPGDRVTVFVAATVDGVAGTAPVDSFRVLDDAVYDWKYGTVAPLTDKAGFKLAADGVDLVAIETGVNLRQSVAAIGAVLAGKYVVDATGTTATFYAMGSPTTERVKAAVGPLGRSSVTLTLP